MGLIEKDDKLIKKCSTRNISDDVFNWSEHVWAALSATRFIVRKFKIILKYCTSLTLLFFIVTPERLLFCVNDYSEIWTKVEKL